MKATINKIKVNEILNCKIPWIFDVNQINKDNYEINYELN